MLLFSGLTIFLMCVGAISGESFADKLLRMAYEVETDPELQELWRLEVMAEDLVWDLQGEHTRPSRELMRIQRELPDVRFECDVEYSPSVPASVHRLRPSDVTLIAAFGDSITAGNGLGARTAADVALENRGESYSIGGDDTLDAGTTTLTNVFRKFNPDVKGYSQCVSTVNNLRRSWLNVAVPGATSQDMPDQANVMIDRILADDRINFFGDWKVVTLFIGGNDLCGSCTNPNYSPENYAQKIREAIDIIYVNLPRVYLNLVPMFDVTPLANYSEGRICDRLQTRFCDCAVNASSRADLKGTQMAYYNELKAISEDPKYTNKEDFTIVLQTHLVDTLPPIDPETGGYLPGFLAPDCFHPSRLGHQSMAFWLWNTMLTPVGRKPFSSEVNLGPEPNYLLCPTTANPFLFTNRNSNVQW